MMPRRAAGRSPSIPPSFSAYPPQPVDEEEEAALAISDQRTLYLVNIFISNNARFLNTFADLCQDKLADVHRRILRLDASLTLLEAKLRSTCPKKELEDDSGFKAMGSSSQSILSNLLPLDKSLYRPCVSGESSRASTDVQQLSSALPFFERSHSQTSSE
ncbi:WASH complex subunit 3-like isoform X2 [Phoenix dactylifera]|uniref:WASH complex subunit 3-like isoform X2 n=1 Tax=Phoenix dactylifera TaxID=42345 RepID=A0A8B9A077_PHODC|nr:WASH complex subunit 3-like isoform X2 [Phoenix dactylifera]XP_038976883.1 WASH complex subunit 3-like isoform X2 [Phoenix dactylifera]XP_038976884.1 WASH complex subunit 3-like isoform X2 [Phoenix dactylifera]XP_038976885.1 WASH complex subunit 3-like isoform X2 [Phoenix dactylifera]XP_038976886.1 WASH complex subunit 3-like isoform X2 [Phoenix dactylifera]XP_038976887.1 WASH complex subunit 3-like isoform X2 [Phoenix dactylifera]XP_038976888.1 WASH complex subunit 3-like isoform X2 [Phoe